MEMELRHLRYFQAVAEELNFTRAARRLHIAQPPLTQQIKALEAEMGVTLIDRSAYRIELTDAGRAFAAEVGRILGEVRNAVLVAKRAARSAAGQVRVGFTASASFNPLVTSALRTFRSEYPDIVVSLEESQSTALALREGRIDAAFVRSPLSADGIVVHLLEKEEMVVAVARGRRLARRKAVLLRDLQAETFILYVLADQSPVVRGVDQHVELELVVQEQVLTHLAQLPEILLDPAIAGSVTVSRDQSDRTFHPVSLRQASNLPPAQAQALCGQTCA
jgi:DNA-binding transcriptional LysR family regulator